MTPQALFEHITKHMTAEQALLKLLESSLLQYEKLKFADSEKPVHPLIIISMATMDLGWNFCIEKTDGNEEVRGLVVGTKEYIDNVFKPKKNI